MSHNTEVNINHITDNTYMYQGMRELHREQLEHQLSLRMRNFAARGARKPMIVNHLFMLT